MARHKKSIDEKYSQPFATRFRDLMNREPKTSQAELAEVIGKSRQVISQYYNGESEPPFDVLSRIAKHFNVTADYLIGATDISSTSMDVQEIVRQTGLTEGNVINLIAKNNRVKTICELHKRLDHIRGWNSRHKNPAFILLNFLVEFGLNEDSICIFQEIVDILDVPSSMGFIQTVLHDDDFKDIVHQDAIVEGVAEFFNLETDDEGLLGARFGMWSMGPEEAFEYYCSRLAEDLRNTLIYKFNGESKWGDIEPYRKELREVIEKVDASWNEREREMMGWPVSKNEMEATE